MPAISSDVLRLLEDDAPDFIAKVDKSAHKPYRKPFRRIVRTTLHRFDDNPVLLYAALAYARSQGVAVTFIPTK